MKFYIAVAFAMLLMAGIFVGAIYFAFIDDSTGYTPSEFDRQCMISVESRQKYDS